MSQVYLLRHAKAVWPSPGQKDFDRTLDTAGIEAARILGQELRRSGLKPEIVICSTRYGHVRPSNISISRPPFILEQSEKLFSGGPDAYLMAIRMAGLEHETANSVMLVGHNPMMEELAIALAGRGQPPIHPDLRVRVSRRRGLPSSNLTIRLPKSAREQGHCRRSSLRPHIIDQPIFLPLRQWPPNGRPFRVDCLAIRETEPHQSSPEALDWEH